MRFAALLAVFACLACRTPPRGGKAPAGASGTAPRSRSGPRQPPPPAQPGAVIAEVRGIAVLALGAPAFAQLETDQRLFALEVANAFAAGDATALDQGYRHNVAIARLLRGILSRKEVLPADLLPRVRDYARAVWLNHGIHDVETGRKLQPEFSVAQLRLAALSAQAAGADLGLRGAKVEYALRALEGPLFDPRVDAQRTSHVPDPLQHSAANLYGSVSMREVEGFREQFPNNSSLVRERGALVEKPWRLPLVADGLERALFLSAPPQREVLEPLAVFFRTGDPGAFRDAAMAWLDEAGPADFFGGFLDTSADPRGRKGLFGGAVGVADPSRTAPLDELSDDAHSAKAAFLASAAGSFKPLLRPGLTVALAAGSKCLLFAAADDAAAALREPATIAALAPPELASDLAACAPEQRFAFLALRELFGRSPPANAVEESDAWQEARADLAGWSHPTGPLLSERCAQLYPQYAATSWLAASADLPEGDRVESDRQRAIQLAISWFRSKGAVSERKISGRRYLIAADTSRFRAAAQELDAMLRDLAKAGDAAKLEELLTQRATRIDGSLRDEVAARLRSARVPKRVAILAPRIEAVVKDGKTVDAQATPIQDLDAEILRDWSQL